MTQSLLDLTKLLNSNNELNLTKQTSKDYTETFSNGKSFNEIFSNANNNYASKENKPLSNSYDNSRNSTKNSKSFVSDSSKNATNENSSNITGQKDNKFEKTNENVKSKNSDEFKSKSNENETTNADTKTSTVKDEDAKTVANTDSKTNTVILEDTFELDSLKNIDITEFSSSEDIFAFVDSANVDVNTEDFFNVPIEDVEVTEPDMFLNAYYQSTLTALETAETDADIAVTADAVIQEETMLEDVDIFIEEALKTPVSDETTTVEATLDKTLTPEQVSNADKKQATDALDTTRKVSADTTEQTDTKEVKADLKVQTKDDGVEVETAIKEEKVDDTEILVEAADEVVDEVQAVDLTKGNKKANAREALEKAGLGETELASLNVTVKSVGSASADLTNGFGTQSNAQEEIAKMALNPNHKAESTLAADKNFSKIIDTTKSEEPKEISKNEILTQINNKMQAQNINGKNKITLMLSPESLGKITVELVQGKNGLEARMLTDNAQVRDLLEKNLDGLKSTLSSQGVSVNNVSVKVASASESSSEFSFNRENFNGEENSQQQNFQDAGDTKDEKSQFANNKGNSELTEEEALANLETEELNSEETDGIRVSSTIGNVDIEA